MADAGVPLRSGPGPHGACALPAGQVHHPRKANGKRQEKPHLFPGEMCAFPCPHLYSRHSSNTSLAPFYGSRILYHLSCPLGPLLKDGLICHLLVSLAHQLSWHPALPSCRPWHRSAETLGLPLPRSFLRRVRAALFFPGTWGYFLPKSVCLK